MHQQWAKTQQMSVNPPKSTRSQVYILTAVITAIAEDKGKRGGEKGDKSPVTELTLGWLEAHHSDICSVHLLSAGCSCSVHNFPAHTAPSLHTERGERGGGRQSHLCRGGTVHCDTVINTVSQHRCSQTPLHLHTASPVP